MRVLLTMHHTIYICNCEFATATAAVLKFDNIVFVTIVIAIIAPCIAGCVAWLCRNCLDY